MLPKCNYSCTHRWRWICWWRECNRRNIVLTRNVGGDISFALGSIDEHSDVDTTTTLPADTDVLTWVAANSRWEPAASGGGGGNNAPVAAINGLTENVNAFSTLTYSQFDTSDRTTQTWLTPGASNQTITEAGDYIVEFSVRDTVGSKDFTVNQVELSEWLLFNHLEEMVHGLVL